MAECVVRVSDNSLSFCICSNLITIVLIYTNIYIYRERERGRNVGQKETVEEVF